jgi:hypothetical protein
VPKLHTADYDYTQIQQQQQQKRFVHSWLRAIFEKRGLIVAKRMILQEKCEIIHVYWAHFDHSGSFGTPESYAPNC